MGRFRITINWALSGAQGAAMGLRRAALALTALAFLAGCATGPSGTVAAGGAGGGFGAGPRAVQPIALREDIRPDNPFLDPQFVLQAHRSILGRFGVYRDPRLTRYVQGVADRVARAGGVTDVTLTIVDNGGVNAFAGAGGYIYVTRGLLMLATSEDELAFVLAHEIAHVIAQDVERRFERVRQAEAASAAAAADAAARGDFASQREAIELAVAIEATLAAASRQDEIEADEAGGRMLVRAGYAAQAQFDMLARLAAWSSFEGRPAGATWLDTHPSTDERIRRARAAAGGAPADLAASRARYYAQIDGLPVFNRSDGVEIAVVETTPTDFRRVVDSLPGPLQLLIDVINDDRRDGGSGRIVRKVLVPS